MSNDNDFRNRIKLTPAPKEGYEITEEEAKILEGMKKNTQRTYKGARCIDVPELYLTEEDYQRIYDNTVKPVLEACDAEKTKAEGGESR